MKHLLSIILLFFFFVVFPMKTYSLQSGGAAYGDYETGSVSGIPFKSLAVDFEVYTIRAGGKVIWFPPTIVLNLRSGGTGGRAGNPILIKATNKSSSEHGFELSADSAFAGPSSLHVKATLKPGETKYIGIPMSDLSYVTANNTLKYRCQLHAAHLGGQLFIIM